MPRMPEIPSRVASESLKAQGKPDAPVNAPRGQTYTVRRTQVAPRAPFVLENEGGFLFEV